MYNITLISTEHMESGKCNSKELYKIVELINPDIIFEEEPNDDKYHSYYRELNSFKPLEIKTIINYELNHDIIHIPVDKPMNEYVSLFVLDLLTKEFNQFDDYRQLLKKHCSLRDNYGFDYLNSKRCSELFQDIRLMEKHIISNSKLHENELKSFYNLFQQELNARENAMIENIYNFSKSNKFKQAVFFHGFAHRESLRSKILEAELLEEIKLNWNFQIE